MTGGRILLFLQCRQCTKRDSPVSLRAGKVQLLRPTILTPLLGILEYFAFLCVQWTDTKLAISLNMDGGLAWRGPRWQMSGR